MCVPMKCDGRWLCDVKCDGRWLCDVCANEV